MCTSTQLGNRMGFFSYLTADTNQSVSNIHSGLPHRPVYLLQPNGEPAIKEPAYEGYGHFGGVCCFDWLSIMNFGDDTFVDLAIMADSGHYFEDDDGVYACKMHISEKALKHLIKHKPIRLFEHFEAEVKNGLTANQFIASGDWKTKNIELKHPLKFSFDPEAVYEDLPASQSCPNQGFFY